MQLDATVPCVDARNCWQLRYVSKVALSLAQSIQCSFGLGGKDGAPLQARETTLTIALLADGISRQWAGIVQAVEGGDQDRARRAKQN